MGDPKGGVGKKIVRLRNDMIFKWFAIPYSILVITVAGACYNLFAYFQQIGAAQGYGSKTMTTIKYTVLFGYYLGLIPGYLVRALSPTLAFLVAAVLSLISFSVLGYLANNGEGSGLEWFIMIFFLFTGSMSGSIATIAGIVTPVKSFPKMASILIIVMFIAYYKIAPYFEFSIRSGFIEDPDLMWYFIEIGVIQAIVFAGAAFIIQEIDLGGAIENVIKEADRAGLLTYVLLEVILMTSFYIVALIYENWFIGAILFLVFLFLNFLAVGGAVPLAYGKAKSAGLKASQMNREARKEMSFEEMLGQPKYLCLVFSSMFIVGTSSTFSFNTFQIAFADGQIAQADHYLDTFWGADMFGRIGGGLLAYFLINSINGYKWAIGSAMSVALGFGLALLTEPVSGIFLYIAVILIGLGAGVFWVIVPSIVMEDGGEKNFGLNWGLTLFMNTLGMLIFGELFDYIYTGKGGGEKCSGGNCVLIQFITFGILALISAGLCYYALSEDENQDNKGRKGGNRGTNDRGRSKHNGRKGNKKKSKSKSKSKRKTKSKRRNSKSKGRK